MELDLVTDLLSHTTPVLENTPFDASQCETYVQHADEDNLYFICMRVCVCVYVCVYVFL